MSNLVLVLILTVTVILATALFITNKGDLRKLRIIGTLDFVAIVLWLARLVDYLREQFPALDAWCKANTVFEMVIMMGIYVLAAWYFLSPLATNSPDSRYYHFEGKHHDELVAEKEARERKGQPQTAQSRKRRENQWKAQQRKKKHRR